MGARRDAQEIVEALLLELSLQPALKLPTVVWLELKRAKKTSQTKPSR